jgi:hypothetical protein
MQGRLSLPGTDTGPRRDLPKTRNGRARKAQAPAAGSLPGRSCTSVDFIA